MGETPIVRFAFDPPGSADALPRVCYPSYMFIRELQPADIDRLREIDGAVESMHYLHLEAGGEGLAASWKISQRDFREKLIEPNVLSEDLLFLAKQVATGMDEGVALVSEYEDNLIGLLLARIDNETRTLQVADVRVDYDYRRQGMGLALGYRAITIAREMKFRAVFAESRTNNFPANQFLLKSGFELSGLDTKRYTNHDLVKEMATLLWYVEINE